MLNRMLCWFGGHSYTLQWREIEWPPGVFRVFAHAALPLIFILPATALGAPRLGLWQWGGLVMAAVAYRMAGSLVDWYFSRRERS